MFLFVFGRPCHAQKKWSIFFVVYISCILFLYLRLKDNRLSPLTLDYTSLVSAKHFSVRSVKLQRKNQMSRRKGQQRKVQKDDSNWCCDVGWFWVMLLWLLWVNLESAHHTRHFPLIYVAIWRERISNQTGFALRKSPGQQSQTGTHTYLLVNFVLTLDTDSGLKPFP